MTESSEMYTGKQIFLVGFLFFVLLVLGLWLQDRWFNILAGMILMIFGLYLS